MVVSLISYLSLTRWLVYRKQLRLTLKISRWNPVQPMCRTIPSSAEMKTPKLSFAWASHSSHWKLQTHPAQLQSSKVRAKTSLTRPSKCSVPTSCSPSIDWRETPTEPLFSSHLSSRNVLSSYQSIRRMRTSKSKSSRSSLTGQLKRSSQTFSWTSLVSCQRPRIQLKKRRWRSTWSSARRKHGRDSMKSSTTTPQDHLTASTGSHLEGNHSWDRSLSIKTGSEYVYSHTKD